MNKKKITLDSLSIPSSLNININYSKIDDYIKWENSLIEFFSRNYRVFTYFPNYFYGRGFEFKLLRQLLPEYFNIKTKYKSCLEIGCGFGFNSMLLSRFCDNLIACDIPKEYNAYFLNDFETSVDLAKYLINEKFKINKIQFKHQWPSKLDEIKNNTISFIFSEYVLEHIPELNEAIKEMYRVMSKGSIMIHIVPNTKDALIQYLKEQVNNSFITFIKELIFKMFGVSKKKLKFNGTIIPMCHSEFLNNYNEQIEIYRLENYLFKFIQNGFYIEKVISTREHNNVIIARKK